MSHQEIHQLIDYLKRKGATLQDICDELNSSNIKTPSQGKSWTKHNVLQFSRRRKTPGRAISALEFG